MNPKMERMIVGGRLERANREGVTISHVMRAITGEQLARQSFFQRLDDDETYEGPPGWLDGDSGNWPLTPEVIAFWTQLPVAMVEEILAAQAAVVDDALLSGEVVATGMAITSVSGGEDPLAEFLIDTLYHLNIPAHDDPDDPLHAQARGFLDLGRDWVTRGDLVDRITESEPSFDVDQVDLVVRGYWELEQVACDHGFVEPATKFKRQLLERELEDWLVAENTAPLLEVGLDVTLAVDPATGKSGRQVVLENRLRPDLICESADGDLIVIELKVTTANPLHVAQLVGYLEPVAFRFQRDESGVLGVLLADGITPEAREAIEGDPRLRIVYLRDLPGWKAVSSAAKTVESRTSRARST